MLRLDRSPNPPSYAARPELRILGVALALIAASVLFTAFTTMQSSAALRADRLRVGLLGDLSGPDADANQAILAGASLAAESHAAIEIVPIDTHDQDRKKLKGLLKKAKVGALIAVPSGERTDEFVALGRSTRMPTLVATPWEPEFRLDDSDPITHLCAGHVDHAIAAGNYALQPLAAKRVAVVHDGNEKSRALAEAFDRNRPIPIDDGGIHQAPATPDGAAALGKTLKSDGVDLVFVATGPAAARTIATGMRSEGPPLLFADGLASSMVATATSSTSRFLEGAPPYFEKGPLERLRNRGDGGSGSEFTRDPLVERGYSAATLLARAVEEAESTHPKKLALTLRVLTNSFAADSTIFWSWGQLREVEFFVCKRNEKTAERINPLTMPDVGGGTMLRFRESKHYTIDPDTHMVYLTWGEGDDRTIDDDLKNLGLSSRGYEADMDNWVRDEIMARAIAYLHKVFQRNADGTAIPGVSFDVTFGTEMPPGVKPHQIWTVTIAGDDPSAWGRAYPPNRAFAYASKLANEIYKKYELKPPLQHSDRDYFVYKYRWNTGLEGNLRHDSIRALVDGYASAVAMTTAHEVGHLCGCDHDRESPRSIMNVVDGGGISPLWADWIPKHLAKIAKSMKYVDD